jgi:hypothetical protein
VDGEDRCGGLPVSTPRIRSPSPALAAVAASPVARPGPLERSKPTNYPLPHARGCGCRCGDRRAAARRRPNGPAARASPALLLVVQRGNERPAPLAPGPRRARQPRRPCGCRRPRPTPRCVTLVDPRKPFPHRRVDTERKARVPRALSCPSVTTPPLSPLGTTGYDRPLAHRIEGHASLR